MHFSAITFIAFLALGTCLSAPASEAAELAALQVGSVLPSAPALEPSQPAPESSGPTPERSQPAPQPSQPAPEPSQPTAEPSTAPISAGGMILR